MWVALIQSWDLESNLIGIKSTWQSSQRLLHVNHFVIRLLFQQQLHHSLTKASFKLHRLSHYYYCYYSSLFKCYNDSTLIHSSDNCIMDLLNIELKFYMRSEEEGTEKRREINQGWWKEDFAFVCFGWSDL